MKLHELDRGTTIPYCVFTATGTFNRCSVCDYPMMYGITRRCRGPKEVVIAAPPKPTVEFVSTGRPSTSIVIDDASGRIQRQFIDTPRGLIRMPRDGHMGAVEI